MAYNADLEEAVETILNSLSIGVSNPLFSGIAPRNTKNRIREMITKYDETARGFWARKLKVFDPVEEAGRTIYPDQVIKAFLVSLDELASMSSTRAKNYAAVIAGARDYTFTSSDEYSEWSQRFKQLIQDEQKLASDIAIWANNVSSRTDLVGSRARDKLRSYGIDDPGSLGADVMNIAANVLKMYDAYEIRQREDPSIAPNVMAAPLIEAPATSAKGAGCKIRLSGAYGKNDAFELYWRFHAPDGSFADQSAKWNGGSLEADSVEPRVWIQPANYSHLISQNFNLPASIVKVELFAYGWRNPDNLGKWYRSKCSEPAKIDLT